MPRAAVDDEVVDGVVHRVEVMVCSGVAPDVNSIADLTAAYGYLVDGSVFG